CQRMRLLRQYGLPIPLLLHKPHNQRDLHSLPTRRSSDLRDKATQPDQVSRQINELDLCAHLEHVHQAWCLLSGGMENQVHGFGEDRKSTRLNSSHEWISYAVFCLKNKTCGHACVDCRQ